jgi:ABC-type transport system involved in multi-copper enzyme maturation permease subunit
MLLPPIIVRELQVALRRREFVKERWYAGLAAGGTSGAMMLLGLAGHRGWGQSLHLWLCFQALLFGVIRPVRACLGLFSDERRGRTLELLYLSGVTPVQLFFGKLIGGGLVAVCGLVAIFPFLALPFLSGGVSFSLFVATISLLPVMLLFGVAVAVFASALCTDEGAAGVMALLIFGVILLATPIPYLLGKTLTGVPPFSARWLCASPGYAGLLVLTRFGQGTEADFWATLGLTIVWTALCLGAAAVVLARTGWDRVIYDQATQRGFRSTLVFGTNYVRRELTARLLQGHPFQWLAQRDRRSLVLGWFCLGAVCLAWLLGWAAWGGQWPSTLNSMITATILAILIDGLQLHMAARAVGKSRQDGTLELLLTSPLSPAEILEDQLAAMRAQFRPLRRALSAVFLLLMCAGFWARAWTPEAATSYFLIWVVFLLWANRRHRQSALTAFWVALNTGRPGYAVFRTHGNPWAWFWIFFNLRNIGSWGRSAARFPSGSDLELVVVIGIVMIVLIVSAFTRFDPKSFDKRVIQEMRGIAQQPIPGRDDPRFKKWKNVREPFPA